MKEIDCQQLMIDAVEAPDIGGRGLKFNNRFIIGIPDLLIKMPGIEPVILEAKYFTFSAKTLDAGHLIADVGATKLQKDQLRDWSYAGMLTGLVSFVGLVSGDVRDLRMAIYSYDEMVRREWSTHTADHMPLGDKSERLTNIRQQLIQFASGGVV